MKSIEPELLLSATQKSWRGLLSNAEATEQVIANNPNNKANCDAILETKNLLLVENEAIFFWELKDLMRWEISTHLELLL